MRMNSLGLLLGGKWAHELLLLFDGLEFTMSDLGGGIDELDFGVEDSEGRGLWEHSLSNGDNSLSWSHDSTSDQDEVLVDNTVVRESTNWGDVLDMRILFSGGVVGSTSAGTGSNSVDLLVDLGSMEVTLITSSSNSPLNGRWMPSTDTSNLSETSMGLSWKSVDTESLDNTGSSLTSGNGNGINHLVLLEDFSNGDFLLELGSSPFDLLGGGSSVNLDFHKMSLLLSESLKLVHLGGAKNSNGRAVFLDSLDISVNVLLGLSVFLISLGVVGESLLFGEVVVLIESSNDTFWKVLGPGGGESSESSWGLDVSNHTDNLHWWGLKNGTWLDDILSDCLLTFLLFFIPDDVSHTGFVSHEGGKMNWLSLIIWREGSDVTLGVLASSLWKISQMTASWMLKLSVRHV